MTVSIQSVARTLGKLSGWTLSNLALQKIAYMAEMIHLGRNNEPLTHGDFEAWDRGPVSPSLYHWAKMFGAKPVTDIFRAPYLDEDTPEYKSVKAAFDLMKDKTPWQMVTITHWPKGAWAAHYIPGALGSVIPKAKILAEYRARTQ